MESFAVFKEKCIALALDTYKSEPALDGTLLLFAESDSMEDNALWGITFSDQEEKDQLLAFLAISMDKRKSQRYSIMSLAWMNDDPAVLPSESSSRKEVLLVGVSEKHGEKSSFIYDVVRSESDQIIDFKQRGFKDLQSHSGLMFNLLDRQNDNPIPEEIYAFADLKLAKMLMSGETVVNRPAHRSSPYKKPN